VAFSVQSGSGGRGRGRASGAMSEMNVVPLVDVVLVLLIIFMLTAHVMEFGLEVDVPAVRSSRDSAEDLPVVNITRDGELFLGDVRVNINELAPQLGKRYKTPKAVFVRADKATPWENVAQVFSELGEAKIEVRAVTKTEERVNAPKGR
jgi:biopolymer transport protein ExbD